MSYYDLNAIQTDSQKLPCTFTLTVPRLGHLESPQNANQPITSGTKLYLPLWLGVMLALSNANSASNGGPGGEGMVEMDFPACLERKVINALKADGRAVDLRGLNAHFFGVGGRVLEVFEDEGVEGVLVEVSSSSSVLVRACCGFGSGICFALMEGLLDCWVERVDGQGNLIGSCEWLGWMSADIDQDVSETSS